MRLHQKIRDFKAKKRHPVFNELLKMAAVVIGAILVAVGLEQFLVPNNFLDGGITGVSILLTNFFSLPLGVFLAVLNIPFIVLSFFHSGFKTALRTAVGISVLAVSTILLHHIEPLTHEFALALGYGGLLVGVGVGLALRYGGALDGAEALAVILSKKTNVSVDRIILVINFCIFLVAAFINGPEAAMASFLLFYIVVTPIIKKVMEGGSETRSAQIITSKPDEVADAVNERLNRRVMSVAGQKIIPGKIDALEASMLTVVIARMEEPILTELVEELDERAVIIFTDVQNVHGSVLQKSKHH